MLSLDFKLRKTERDYNVGPSSNQWKIFLYLCRLFLLLYIPYILRKTFIYLLQIFGYS